MSNEETSLLALAADILGEMPKNEAEAIFELQQRLIDGGHDWLDDVSDLAALIDTISILEGKSVISFADPFDRIDSVIAVDQYKYLPEIKLLGDECKKLGWILQERKLYYSLIRGGKVVFKILGIRNTNSDKFSLRLIFRQPTYTDMEIYLKEMDLIQYKNKEWAAGSMISEQGREILGRYFFFDDVYKFLENITKRMKNDEKTKKMAGLQLAKLSRSGNKQSKNRQ